MGASPASFRGFRFFGGCRCKGGVSFVELADALPPDRPSVEPRAAGCSETLRHVFAPRLGVR